MSPRPAGGVRSNGGRLPNGGWRARRRGAEPWAAVLACAVALALFAGCTAPVTSGHPGATPKPSGPVLHAPVRDSGPHPLGAKWIWARLDMSSDYLRQVSGGATWHEVVWCDIEKERGHRQWGSVDRVARLTQELDFTLGLKIRTGACWATREGATHVRGIKQRSESHIPRDMQAYAGFVRAVVDRYEDYRVRQFAIENEPNAPWFWGGTVGELVATTRVGVRAIRDANPEAEVSSWGVSSSTYGLGVVSRLLAEGRGDEAVAAYNRYFVRRPREDYPVVSTAAQLRGILDRQSAVRALNFLHAAERLLDEGVFDVRQVHFYEPWTNVAALAEYLEATTPADVPIEVWEAGQYWVNGPTDENVRARHVAKTLALLLGHGMRRVVWLPLMTEPAHADTEQRYGLQAPNGDVRLAGVAYRRMVEWSREASVSSVGIPGASGVAFGRDFSTGLVVWSDEGRTVAKPPGVAVAASDLAGRQVRWPASGLRLTSVPIFVEIAAPKSKALRLLRG